MKTAATIVCLAWIAGAATAQELPVTELRPEHQWLKKFVGEWELVSESVMSEDDPPIIGELNMSSKMMGDLWVVNSSVGKVAGTEINAIQMIGFDHQKEKYVGIWADSIVNHLWHYEGSVNEAGNKITLEASGPSMTGEGTEKYRDSYEFKDADTVIATSEMMGPDGEWITISKGTGKRRQ